MSNEKRYLLSYKHDEIQNILNRVNAGQLLTKADYDYLINKIGLDKLSVLTEFNGYYDSLKGKPNIDYMIAIAIAENNLKVIQELTEKIETDDNKIIESLDGHIKEYEKLISELQSGLIKLDKDSRMYIDNSVRDLKLLLEDSDKELDIKINNKSDKDHVHLIEDIVELPEVLESKSDTTHIHANDHVHTNKGVIDAINELTIKKWDAKADSEEIPTKVSQLVNDNEYLILEDLITYMKDTLPDFDQYLPIRDIGFYLANLAEKNHMHKINNIDELADTLHGKVDKIKGYSLIKVSDLNRMLAFMERPETDSIRHIHEYTDPDTGTKEANLEALNHINFTRIEMWDRKINEHQLEETLKNYTTNEIIKNYYRKDETYSREEIINKIEEYGFGTMEEIDERLGHLTLVPILKADFDLLTDEQKHANDKLYIITDILDTSEEFMTMQMFDDRFLQLMQQSEEVVSSTKLEDRLDGMSFKRLRTKEYQDGIASGEINPEDTSIMYVITDSYEHDTNDFITKDELESKLYNKSMSINRPEEPAVGQCFFDPEVGLPLWFNGEKWIDAMGNER